MLVSAAAAWQFVLGIHIVAVVAAFGVVFSYPLFLYAGRRLGPGAMPWFHRMQARIGQRLINPGLTVVLAAGIYLAADLHQWHEFYVQWGIGAVVVIGAVEGSVMIRNERRLAELAERDLAASTEPAEVAWSDDYRALLNRTGAAGGLLVGIVVVTIFLMATQS